MAKKWSNKNLPGALHFITGNVLNRRSIFQSEDNCRALLKEMQDLRTYYECKLIAIVIMLDHFHLIINPKDGDIQKAVGILKSFSAKAIIRSAPIGTFANGDENQVWQESFKALPLWSRWMIEQKINYIHANPVRASLCSTAEDYPWTSFRSFYRIEPDPLLAVDKKWWWDDDEDKLAISRREWETEKMDKMVNRIDENRRKLE